MIIRYKSVIINGLDKAGQVETLPGQEGQRLVDQGYAEIFEETEIIPVEEMPVISQEIKRKRK